MSQYYGPAGIFSTDDPTTDAMQIAAEYGPEEEWDEEPPDEWPPEEDRLYGCCPRCIWWSSADYWVDDPVSLERARDRLCVKHRKECPDCDGELEFG
jgi:hypothetical protein